MKKMRKMKRFSEGGFSKAQESWLEGADRTDPFILARMRKAVPDEVKTETAPVKTEAEPAKATPVKVEPEFVTVSPDSPNLGTSKVETAAKPRTPPKPKPKEEAKAESKVETKVDSKVEADDKPAPVKPVKETKPAVKKYTSPGAFDATDEERAENRSKLFGGIKEFGSKLFSRPEKVDRSGSRGQKGFEDIKAKQRASASMKAEGSYKAGGKVKSASARADGCAIRGKTRA
jgi:outer membrane biosynthesis protein TonB